MCCTKLSCLFEVVAQKSSRSMQCLSRDVLPSSPTIVDARLLAEGRIGEHEVEALAGLGGQRVGHLDRRTHLSSAPMPCRNRFIAHSARGAARAPSRGAPRSLRRRFCVLGRGSGGASDDVVVRGEQEAAGAAGRVADRLAGPGRMQSTIAWISARGVKYWPAPDFVLGVLLQQALVDVALDVGAQRRPVLLVDQIDDQPPQLGRVLDLVLRLAEDERRACPSRCPALRARGGSGRIELGAVASEQRRPGVSAGDQATAGCTAAASARPPSSGTADR